jgi:tRNA-binding protein
MKPAPPKPEVTLAEIEKLDVRVGTILEVHDVEASAKLVRLVVDLGDGRRNVLAGLKRERADPREILGKQALFVVNLPPRALAGELSEAMLFDIGHADGIVPALAVPERPVPNGARAG